MSDPLNAVPRPPAGLPPVARSMWKRVASLLVADGRLHALHLPALEALSRDAAMIADLEKTLAKCGFTMVEVKDNGSSSVKARPEVQMLSVTRRRYDALCAGFGIVPTQTKKLPAPSPVKSARIKSAADQYAKLMSEIDSPHG